jgi:hypothetical protein
MLERKAFAASTAGGDAVADPPEPISPVEPLVVGALDVALLADGCALATGRDAAGVEAPGVPAFGDADEPHAATVVTRTSPATAVPSRWSVAVANI